MYNQGASSTIRMSGMNSGLDTESIVEALCATTKNKINTQERKVLELKAQQEAYQDIITKMTDFKDKYFDILNNKTYLGSSGIFNRYSNTISYKTSDGTYVEGTPAGVSVTTSANSGQDGEYDVEIRQAATQTTIKSQAAGTSSGIDFDSLKSGSSYTMTVTVGSTTQNITFEGGDKDNVISSINEQLKVFGESSSSTDKGLIYVDDSGNFVSRNQQQITATTAVELTSQKSISLDGVQTGNNSVVIQVGDQQKTVTFSTVSEDYYDNVYYKKEDGTYLLGTDGNKILRDGYKRDETTGEYVYEKDEYGNDVLNANGEKIHVYEDEFYKKDSDGNYQYDSNGDKVVDTSAVTKLNSTVSNYKEVRSNLYDDTVNQDYEAWKAANPEDSTARTELFDKAFNAATEEQYDKYLNKAFEKAYEAGIEDGTITSYEDAVANGDISDVEGADNYQSREDYITQTLQDKYQTDYDNAVADGTISNVEGAENYKSLDDYIFQDQLTDDYDAYTEIKLDANLWKAATYDEFSAYKEYEYTYTNADGAALKGEDAEAAFNEEVSEQDVANWFNTCTVENSLGSIVFSDGTKLVADVHEDVNGNLMLELSAQKDGANVEFAVSAGEDSTNSLGLVEQKDGVSRLTNTTTIADLGLEPDSDGNYGFSINGVSFSFDETATIKEIVKAVNDSEEAGVKMTFSSLDNTFTITNKEYGAGKDITLTDGTDGNGAGSLLSALGFNGGETKTLGQNAILTINGTEIETDSNSYEVDGTTFNFNKTSEGSSFHVDVAVDYTDAIDAIKSFVADYNQLLEDVYAYLDEKPDSDYYFLTDSDLEDMDLSEKQEEKWETKAKQGILYNDSTVSTIMSKLRTTLYGSVNASDGTVVSFPTIGISFDSDWTTHGKLVLDEDALTEAFTNYADEITKLFTDSENGIMGQFKTVLESAVKTTGARADKGTLVQKAGTATGTSATDNAIYDQLQTISDLIDTLNDRYESEQERYWDQFSYLETMMSELNSQSSYITQLMSM